MIRTLGLLPLLLVLSAPLAAQDTRSLTDGTGTDVIIPAQPKRIVTLHDSQLTIPLIELGVLPIASHGRTDEAGANPFIRSGMILTGTDFTNAPIQWVGDYPADLERIAAAAPDLILTTEWMEIPPDQLRQIAPTVVIDTTKPRDEIYDVLADIAGPEAQENLARLRARYAAQIAQIRTVIEHPETLTVATYQIYEGTIYASHTWGNLGQVLRDAGFAQPAIIDSIAPGSEAEFSIESLPEFDADIILATYNTGWGNELSAERDSYLTAIPEFCEQVFACRSGQMFFIPRDEAFSMSFDALGMTAYALLALLGGQDIQTRAE